MVRLSSDTLSRVAAITLSLYHRGIAIGASCILSRYSSAGEQIVVEYVWCSVDATSTFEAHW
jgi:hypothetical protein